MVLKLFLCKPYIAYSDRVTKATLLCSGSLEVPNVQNYQFSVVFLSEPQHPVSTETLLRGVVSVMLQKC